MRLFVDAIVLNFQKKEGGSGPRIFLEILPWMCKINKSLEVTLLAQGCDRNMLPKHERIVWAPAKEWPIKKGVLGKILIRLQRYLYFLYLPIKVPAIWYSTYYTLPPKWNGPVVMWVADLIHDLYPDLFTGSKNEEFRRRRGQCIMQADAVICISETTRRDVINFYKVDPAKVHVALLACSEVFRHLGQEQQQYPRLTDKPFLLYIGARVHYKNYDFFIRTYAHWVQGKDLDVVLVGPPLEAQQKEVLRRLGISGRVHSLNAVDDEYLCVLYNQAAAFVYPSVYEGFGLPLLEAMACGCPIVASDIPSSREIAKDVPYYFSCHDQKDFMCALDQALLEKDPVRMARGKEVCGTYSWEKTARQTLDILEPYYQTHYSR